jgi:hypothetical protein
MVGKQFRKDTSIIVVGPSGSGKTSLVLGLLKDLHCVFEPGIERVFFCSTTPISDITCPVPVHVQDTFPDHTIFAQPHSLVIIDDFQEQLSKNSDAIALSSKIAHHNNCTLIYLLQSMYTERSVTRSLFLNSQYIIILGCQRSVGQIKNFLMRMFPNNWSKVLKGFESMVQESFSHVLFDMHPRTEYKNMIRSGLLQSQPTCILEIQD